MRTQEPLWLPAGWLAVVMMLTSAVPAMAGVQGADGWRSRGATQQSFENDSQSARRDSLFRQVDFQSDIAGPVARVANRSDARGDGIIQEGYRVAQSGPSLESGDPLLEAIERPFGVTDEQTEDLPAPSDAGDLFDDLPADPFEEPMVEAPEEEPTQETYEDDWRTEPTPAYEDPQPTTPDYDYEPARPRDLADDYPDRLAEERALSQQDCEEGLEELRAKTLDTIDLKIGVAGVEGEDYPFICSIHEGEHFEPRAWPEITYMWKASALCHKPLYWEEGRLERYGHSWGPVAQPFVSGAHFFSRFAVLPYCMGLKAPNECVYTLGHYRPGNCAPYLINPVPFTWRAAIYQAGGVFAVGGILP